MIPTPLRLRESPRIRNHIFENRTKPTNVSDGPQEKGICTLQQGDKTVNISILNLINMLLLYAAFKVLESRNSDGSCGLTTL